MSAPAPIQGRCDPRFERVRRDTRANVYSTTRGIGYVMNRMHQGLWLADPRPRRLLGEAYACL